MYCSQDLAWWAWRPAQGRNIGQDTAIRIEASPTTRKTPTAAQTNAGHSFVVFLECVVAKVVLKKHRKRPKKRACTCTRRRCSSFRYDHVLTRTVQKLSLLISFNVINYCAAGLYVIKFEVWDGSSTPQRFFSLCRRFNWSQPAWGRPGLPPPPLFTRSKEMCASTVVKRFVMNTTKDCPALAARIFWR